MKLLRYGATTDRLRDPRGPAYSPDGQTRIRLGNEHPVAKRRRMHQEAFEGPGERIHDMATSRAARLKAKRENDAVAWIQEVRARKVGK